MSLQQFKEAHRGSASYCPAHLPPTRHTGLRVEMIIWIESWKNVWVTSTFLPVQIAGFCTCCNNVLKL